MRFVEHQNKEADKQEKNNKKKQDLQDFPELCEEKGVCSHNVSKKDLSSHDAIFVPEVMCSLSSRVDGAHFENDIAEQIVSSKTQVNAEEISESKAPMISMASNELLNEDGTENKEDENCHKIECKEKEESILSCKPRENVGQPKIPAYHRTSMRSRGIPKVYTPGSSEAKVYCFCQREDAGWYIVCSFQFVGCLTGAFKI